MAGKSNIYIIYSRDPIKKGDTKSFTGVGVGIKHINRKGEPYIQIKTRHKTHLFNNKDYGVQIIPAGSKKALNKKVYNPMPRGRPKKGVKTKKEKLIESKIGKVPKRKGRPNLPATASQFSNKIPTRTINMHGTLYHLHDEKPRTKQAAQVLATALRNQGKSAFLNPRKRKSGTEYFVYEKGSERSKKALSKPKGKKLISKRTGVPTKTINMHGKNYNLYDQKARSKAKAQKVRMSLKAQGKSAFLNPRKRKSGTEYFVYVKPSEKRVPKSKQAMKQPKVSIKQLEAELRRLKRSK